VARTGRPKAELIVSDEEREELERLARRSRTNRNLALRAKIILRCADGLLSQAVAKQLRTSGQTVCKWRQRFVSGRVAGLYDEPRPGCPRKISDEQVEEIVVKTLETKPKGRTHWSTRKMADAAGISASSVGRIWRTFALQPHVVKTFKISDDPLFVEKVRDIVGLYMNPPEHAAVFSFDEKPQIQALERAQPILPMDLGMPERQTHNYIRRGTLDLFAALNIATGEVIAKTKQQHRAKDFVAFLREIDERVPADLDIHVILDNLSAHKAPAVKRWLARHPRFHLHFTPTYSSWLNLVERFFGLLTEHALRRGSHTSVPDLRRALHEYVDAHNAEGKAFKWTKTADEILDSIKRFGQRTLQVHGGAAK
jgi:transposase